MSQPPQSPSAESQLLSLCSTIGVSASVVDAGLVSRLVDVLKSEGCDVRLFFCSNYSITVITIFNLTI